MTSAMAVVELARALAPTIRERAAEGEAAGTMPADLVEQIRAAGLFHLAMPAAVAGRPPHDPETIIRVFEEVAKADGSAGWTVLIGNSTSFVAWLEPSVARELVATRPDFVASSSFAPSAGAVPAGDGTRGFTVSGRWPFTSGAPHADWFANGAMVMDGDRPRMLGPADDRRPDWRFVWLPASDVQVLDTWHAAGLRGTGSHDTSAHDVTVAEELTIAPLFEPAKAGDDFFRMPFFSLLSVFIAGFGLGVVRGALDELEAVAQAKSRRFDGARMADDETVQVEVSRLEAAYGSCRAYLFDVVGAMWSGVKAGREPELRQRADVLAAMHHVFRTGLGAVDTAFRLAGGGALFESSPLQRSFRDIHAASQHIALSLVTERTAGQVFLGQHPQAIML